jgi:tRNA U34 5-methylaminomethyl-2-thiouridine-forming methyltransferase MnmC
MKMEAKAREPVELLVTGDGSHTLHVPGLQENYHSVYGAIAESRHIFINAGLNFIIQKNKRVKILEIGFGTGLNALLTMIESALTGIHIDYWSLELHPLPEEVLSKLNYPEMIDFPGATDFFRQIHSCPWNMEVQLSDNFHLNKIHVSLSDYQPGKEEYDLVYFDAFGPDVQPEIWSQEVFIKMAMALKINGILVTYSTKGTVKRNLKSAGFTIEKLPGPRGKREILRAVKSGDLT